MHHKGGHSEDLKRPESAAHPPDGMQSLKGVRVLIVEDEMIVAMDMELSLEMDGALIAGTAATLEQGLAMIASRDFDCAVLDSNLGGTRVFPIADILYERRVPFIFHTGFLDQSFVDQHWPGTAIVVKPSQHHQITAPLAAALDSSS